MKTHCFEPKEIAGALDLPEGDPGRRHLDRCPRCRSLALAYYEFMETNRHGDIEFETADRDLQQRLARAFNDWPRERRPWWRVDLPRPIWASAAVAIAAGAVLLLVDDLGRLGGGDLPPEPGVLRGGDPASGLLVEVGAGGLVASWPAGPAADEAVLVFYDGQMRELGRVATGGSRVGVGPGDPLASAVYCRLLHVTEGDTVARSAIVAPRPARE